MKLFLSADEEIARGGVTTALLAGRGLSAGGAGERVGVVVVNIAGFREEYRQRLLHHVVVVASRLQTLSFVPAESRQSSADEEEQDAGYEAGGGGGGMAGRTTRPQRLRERDHGLRLSSFFEHKESLSLGEAVAVASYDVCPHEIARVENRFRFRPFLLCFFVLFALLFFSPRSVSAFQQFPAGSRSIGTQFPLALPVARSGTREREFSQHAGGRDRRSEYFTTAQRPYTYIDEPTLSPVLPRVETEKRSRRKIPEINQKLIGTRIGKMITARL